MKRKPTTVKKTVRILTDPKPVFVSLVGAGANGTPLRIIKMEEMETDMTGTLKKGNTAIAGIVFRSDKFTDEAAVKAWLDAGGYEAATITKKDDGDFFVEGDTSVEAPEEIEQDDGTVLLVGQSSKTVDIDAKAEVTEIEGQKTEAPTTGAQKDAAEDKEAPVQPVATVDGLPVTPIDIATTLLIKNEDGSLSIKSLKDGYGIRALTEVISTLAYLKSDMDYDAFWSGTAPSGIADNIRTVIKSLGDILIQMASSTVEQAAKAEAPAEEAPTNPGESQETETEAPPPASETAKDAGTSEALLALTNLIGTLTESVKAVGAEVAALKGANEENAKKAEQLADRLGKVEAVPQARKSADVEDLSNTKPTQAEPRVKSAREISQEVRALNSRNLMGI